jgi:hypothetical protein
LNRAVWSPLAASHILLNLLIDKFVPSATVVFGIDATLERRRGKKISALGIYHDAVRSSKSYFVKATGLRWLSLMLLVDIPWAGRVWALPFLTILCPSKRYYEERGHSHRKLTDRAIQMILLVKRWLVTREIVITADGSFAALEFLHSVREHATIVTRLRMDAGLYEPAAKRKPKQRGRPSKKGKRLPILERVSKSKTTKWQAMTISNWYGEAHRIIEITSGTCVWYHAGKSAVPIKWVLIRDPKGKFKTQAVLCTNLEAQEQQIIEWYVMRWQIEVTFQESRQHLGVETQRQWSDKAIKRTTPVLLGMYSMITLMGKVLDEQAAIKGRSAAWYKKERATFSDTIARVRQSLWGYENLQMCREKTEMIKIPRALYESITDALCYAA